MNTVLSINVNICFGDKKEPTHRNDPFDYPYDIVWFRNQRPEVPTI